MLLRGRVRGAVGGKGDACEVLGRLGPALHSPIPSPVFQRREDGSVNFFRGWEAYPR